MFLLIPPKELSIHYTSEVDEVVRLVFVVAGRLRVFPDREPWNRVHASESGGSAGREVLVRLPVELQPGSELRGVLDELGKGQAAPVALLRDPIFVLPLPELVEEDVGQFFESSSRMSSRKFRVSWA
jgi:hypothetical protein